MNDGRRQVRHYRDFRMAPHMRYPLGATLMVLAIARFVGGYMAKAQSPGA